MNDTSGSQTRAASPSIKKTYAGGSSTTFNGGFSTNTGTATFEAAATEPGWLCVEVED